MLNRKEKLTHRTGNQQNGHARKEAVKAKPIRRRFIISPKAAAQMQASAQQHPKLTVGVLPKPIFPPRKLGQALPNPAHNPPLRLFPDNRST